MFFFKKLCDKKKRRKHFSFSEGSSCFQKMFKNERKQKKIKLEFSDMRKFLKGLIFIETHPKNFFAREA